MTVQSPFGPGDIVISGDLVSQVSLLLNIGLDGINEAVNRSSDRGKGFRIHEESVINNIAQIVGSIVLHESLFFVHLFGDISFSYEPFQGIVKALEPPADFIESVKNLLGADSFFHKLEKNDERGFYGGYLSLTNSYVIRRDLDYEYAHNHGLPYKYMLRQQPTENKTSYSVFAEEVIQQITNLANSTINARDTYLPGYYQLGVPLIFNYVIERSRTREDIIPAAIELRQSKEASAFREQLKLLDSATSVGDDRAVGQIIGEIDDKIKSLSNKVEQPAIDMDIAFPLSTALNIGQLAKFAQDKLVRHRKRHLIFIENLYKSGIHARTIHRQLGKLL